MAVGDEVDVGRGDPGGVELREQVAVAAGAEAGIDQDHPAIDAEQVHREVQQDPVALVEELAVGLESGRLDVAVDVADGNPCLRIRERCDLGVADLDAVWHDTPLLACWSPV